MTETRADDVEEEKINHKMKTFTKNFNVKRFLVRNLLLILTLFGVLLGCIIGFCLRIFKLPDTAVILISYPGELYMRILKLIIMPLIISSLISGCSSVNAKLNGKIALRTFTYFLLTSAFNALLGVILAITIHPGEGLDSPVVKSFPQKQPNSVLDSVLDMGRNIVADNIFQATFQQVYTDFTRDASNNVERVLKYRSGINNLGIVFFCTIFGTILGTVGTKGEIIKDFFSTIFEIIMKIVKGILWITPVGLCSIIAGKIISVSNIHSVISQLGWLIFTVILGVLFYQFIILQLVYFVIVKNNPFKYYINILQGTLTAFSAASTAAALPINMDILDNVLNIDPRITRFVLPVGCNTNLDGTAMFLAISTIFIAQMSEFPLVTGTLVTIWFTSTIMSFAVTSVPSSALVILFMILSSLGIPDHNVPLLFAIDWLLDRFRTTNNMLGDCYAAAIVANISEKELQMFSDKSEKNETMFEDKEVMENNITMKNI